jgi:hypothetical protein
MLSSTIVETNDSDQWDIMSSYLSICYFEMLSIYVPVYNIYVCDMFLFSYWSFSIGIKLAWIYFLTLLLRQRSLYSITVQW